MSSSKEDLAFMLQILNNKDYIVMTPELRVMLMETLTGYENLYYELEKWKQNYQSLEKTLYVSSQKCVKYHITDRLSIYYLVLIIDIYKFLRKRTIYTFGF